MADQASDSDIIAVLEPTKLTASDLDPYTSSANQVMEDSLDLTKISASTEKKIHMWLSAHFASTRDAPVSVEKVGPERLKYDRPGYLEQAIALDPTGALAELFGSGDEDGGGRSQSRFHMGGV